MGILQIFRILFIIPITNLLILFYALLMLIHIPFALGFAIILLTISIRLILYPFVSAQLKAAAKMQKVAPHMAKIRQLHKNDKKRQQEELMRLYKEHGINPAAGCLPTIIQLPIIWSLYNVLLTTVNIHSQQGINKINEMVYAPFLKITHVWQTDFFGVSLFATPAKIISHDPFIILVPLVTGVFQFILSKMMAPAEPVQAVKKEGNEEDFQTAFQKQSMFIFPAMIGYFSYSLPLGLSLYWNTFTIFGILQQYLLIGPGGLKHWIDKIHKAE